MSTTWTLDAPTDAPAPADAEPPAVRSRLHRWLRGRPDDPAWVRPALLGLLTATAILYLWGLAANGWGNDFYSAAVQAGSKSWKAFLFGSSDAANTITVDKPPAALWPMALSVRLFGLNAWSVLVPQALMGVATVGLLYAAVRRVFGAAAGLLAGAVLAVTPVAALMFRFNNPDALLTLVMTAAAYTGLRAIEEDRFRWYVLTGVAVGVGFLAKQLQVFLVVPGLVGALLVAGQGTLWRRLRGLLLAGVALVLSAGWWVALVELWPKSSRPYIGGSSNNSFLDLTFGYNGLGRITGQGEAPGGGRRGSGSFPGGPGGGPFSAGRGIGRLFGDVVGGQIAWLLPVALVALVAGLWLTRRRARRDRQRTGLMVWGSWLVVTAGVFSFMSGIFHEYYTVALAPAVAALVGIGGSLLWSHRHHWPALATTAATVGLSTWWSRDLLGRAQHWNGWLAPAITATGAAATLTVGTLAVAAARHRPAPQGAILVAAALGSAALLAGPLAWTLQTVSTPRTGAVVTAGPATSRGGFLFPGGGGPGRGNGPSAGRDPSALGGPPAFPGGESPGGEFTGGRSPGGGIGQGAAPGMGGAAPSRQVVEKLDENAARYEWVAATSGATAAAPYQLATDRAVMPIGGFSGGDPAPTLETFQRLVGQGKIHWYIAGGFGGAPGGFGGGGPGGFQPPAGLQVPAGFEPPAGFEVPEGMMPGPGGFGGRSGASGSISAWVADHFTSVTVDGVTLYDLTRPKAGG